MMRRRLAIVMPMHWSYSLGGAEMQVQMLVQRLVESGAMDVHFVAREVGTGHRAHGYSLHQVAGRRSIAGTYPLDVGPLRRTLDAIAPDVVYQRVGGAYTYGSARWAERHRRAMVWHVSSNNDLKSTPWRATLRSPFEQLDRRLIDYGARHATRVLVQNSEQATLLQRRFGRADALHLPNFHPAPADLPARPADRVTVCWIANLKPLKRPDLLLDLAAQLADRPQLHFLVIGAQQMHGPAWDALLQRLRKADNVSYLGHLAPDTVNEQLAKAHLLVNTSDYEGFPNTFIQAWLRGVPVLSLNVNPDALLDGQCFGHCAAGSLQALGAALAALIDDPARRTALGERSRLAALQRFSMANVERLIGLLQEVAP